MDATRKRLIATIARIEQRAKEADSTLAKMQKMATRNHRRNSQLSKGLRARLRKAEAEGLSQEERDPLEREYLSAVAKRAQANSQLGVMEGLKACE